MTSENARPSTWQSVKAAAASWRLGSITLLMFSSSLPLGLVWNAIPLWMESTGANIKVVGLFLLAQAPWSFKFVWSPFMDRYPLPFLGRKRGWILLTQVALFVLSLGLASAARHPEDLWTIGALALGIAFASASQDIAYDAYTVDVLHRDEYSLAVGARGLMGRLAMLVSGNLAITLGLGYLSWSTVNALLALCYLPMMAVTWFAPEPAAPAAPPRSLRDAVWEPFMGLLAQHRALEILAFVALYKFSDNLAQALLRPFFRQMGFGAWDVGVGTGTVGTVAIIAGMALGGLATMSWGLGRALWIFGFLQSFAHLGYAVVAHMGPSRGALYGAHVFEMGTGGLATGAFNVLLLRLTQKRFSATQYALLTSLMSISRVITGPPAALLVDAVGWQSFFALTVVTGVPGMILLHRFVPWSVREPEFYVAAPSREAPLTRTSLVQRSLLLGALSLLFALGTMGALNAISAYNAGRMQAVVTTLNPSGVELRVRVTEPAAMGGVQAIRDVFETLPTDQVGPVQVGDVVTVVVEKDSAGHVHLSRSKAVARTLDVAGGFRPMLRPTGIEGWLTVIGILLFGALCGLAAAATLAARRGMARSEAGA